MHSYQLEGCDDQPLPFDSKTFEAVTVIFLQS